MAKPKNVTTSVTVKDPERMSWPLTEREVSQTPRLYRMHRMNAFEWQAFVTAADGIEHPIGKPDLFDIIKNKISGVMKAEGQLEFIRSKVSVG